MSLRGTNDCSSASQTKTTTKKLPVAGPISFPRLFVLFAMYGCRQILLIDTMWRAGLYICGVTVGSLISDLVRIPRTYLSKKDNFINVYFVKIGWGWTTCFLGIFIFLTSYVTTCGNILESCKGLVRLMVATAYWMLILQLIHYLENVTGFCTLTDYSSKVPCVRAEGEWLGFDISGHAFLLVHCLLVIVEEAKAIRSWERLPEIISQEEETPARLTSSQLAALRRTSAWVTPLVRVVTVALTLLTILWDMMLLATTLYFHNMPQKLIAVTLAIAHWYVTYHIWYSSGSGPGLPGHGVINLSLPVRMVRRTASAQRLYK